MIPRYTPSDAAALFSDEHRFDTMVEVELLAAEALSALGTIPAADVQTLRSRRPVVDASFVQDVNERELITNHDTAAFVDVLQDRIGMPEGAWIHFGLTSSDVIDTANCRILADGVDLVLVAAGQLRDALTARAFETIDWPVTGRTHGMHAEPTTFGVKFALFALAINRDCQRLTAARAAIAVGKLSGAVGTFSNIDPFAEAFVCERLGLTPVPATQVIARDRHAEVLYALASLGASIESFATEIRHLARSEVGEAEEPFREGQKGSSAMPHKRNPVAAERLCGLARVLRGYLITGLEDVALWHERDISHSSAERIVLPDALTLALYAARQAERLASGLVIHRERARMNLEVGSRGLVFSQSVLLALVESGRSRDDAYRLVQAACRRTVEENRQLRDVVIEDSQMKLDAETLARAFDAERLLAHRHRVLSALDWREP
jgi:adenylosuccinate lyase